MDDGNPCLILPNGGWSKRAGWSAVGSSNIILCSSIGLMVMSAVIISTRQQRIFTNRIGLHIFRNGFHFAGQYGWFLGLGLLPLAEVFALEFTVPIWTLLVAAVALKEQITRRKLLAIISGSIGVLIIVKPGYAIINPASLIVLAAALCYAIAHSTTKARSVTESPTNILFYMCLIQLPVGLFMSLSSWIWPAEEQWIWVIVISLTGLSAHFCMTKAMQYSEVTTIVTIDFLRLPLIAAIGVLLYSEQLEISLMIGGLLMLAGNLINAPRRTQHEKRIINGTDTISD